jgi:hypothetical protein
VLCRCSANTHNHTPLRPCRAQQAQQQAATPSPFKAKNARLVLEDGSVWRGHAFGATGTEVGEVVFNTSITGVLARQGQVCSWRERRHAVRVHRACT